MEHAEEQEMLWQHQISQNWAAGTESSRSRDYQIFHINWKHQKQDINRRGRQSWHCERWETVWRICEIRFRPHCRRREVNSRSNTDSSRRNQILHVGHRRAESLREIRQRTGNPQRIASLFGEFAEKLRRIQPAQSDTDSNSTNDVNWPHNVSYRVTDLIYSQYSVLIQWKSSIKCIL